MVAMADELAAGDGEPAAGRTSHEPYALSLYRGVPHRNGPVERTGRSVPYAGTVASGERTWRSGSAFAFTVSGIAAAKP
jgi:hypothetical protein